MLDSAAIDLVWVAEGRLDASVILANNPWDISAGVIIASEAGAVVTDVDDSPHTPDSVGTVTVTKSLAGELLDLIGTAYGNTM